MTEENTWDSVVGVTHTIADGGKVGDLLTIARKHVDDAVSKSRLTQKEAGQIYTSMIPAAFQYAMEFTLKEKEAEAQVALLNTQKNEAELEGISKRAQTAAQTQLLLDQASELLLNGPKDRLLKDQQLQLAIDQDAEVVTKTAILTEQAVKDLAFKQAQTDLEVANKSKIEYEVSDILPKQIDSEERKLVIQETQATKDLAVKDQQIIEAKVKTRLTEDQDSELLLNGIKDREAKTEQIAAAKQDVLNKVQQVKQSEQAILTEIENTNLVAQKIATEKLNNKPDGVIENQITKLNADATTAKIDTGIKFAEAIANIDKVMGFEVDNVNYNDRTFTVGNDNKDGKLDYERTLAKEQVSSAKIASELVVQKLATETATTTTVAQKIIGRKQ